MTMTMAIAPLPRPNSTRHLILSTLPTKHGRRKVHQCPAKTTPKVRRSNRPPPFDSHRKTLTAMDTSMVNASDAAAREEATSSMLYLSNNHNNNNAARTTSTLPPNPVGLLHSQASPNANYPHCGASSAMEVETMSNENGTWHVKNADATGKEHNGREEAVVPAAASCGSAEFPMRNVRREDHSSTMAPPPTLSSSSSCSSVQHPPHHHHPHHHATTTTRDADHERRGSGYLLLAAEAMERTESRENAIRRAAMELVAAAAVAGGGDGETTDMPRFYHTFGTTTTSTTVDTSATSGRVCPYSARLQQVFEMPSLNAEQLLSSGDDPHCSSSRRRRSSCLDGRTSVTMSMPIGSRLENHEEDRRVAAVSRQEDSIRMRRMEPPPQEQMRGNTLASQDGCSSNSRFSTSSLAPVVSAPIGQSTSNVTPSKINNNNSGGSSKTLTDNKPKSSKSDKNGTTTAAASATTTTSQLLPSGRPRPPPQKHVYHDYANLPDTAPILPLSHGAAATVATTANNDESSPSHPSTSTIVRKKTGGVSQPFPEKLMSMLDNETRHRPEVVSWLPHGRAFLVRKPKVFTSEIMPEYFRQSKLTSFQRQLNLYGFRRITQGADGGAYYHELFLRGRPNLCARMVRQKVKGTGHKQPTDIASEPNFYAMPSVEPLPEAVASYSSTMQQQQQQPLIEDDDQDYDSYMNSPGIRAAALLKRMSSVGTPSQFSLDEYTNNIHPPPLVSSGMGAMDRAQSDVFRPINFGPSNLYSFDSFRSENSATFAYTPFVTVEPRSGPNDETTGTDAGINEEGGSSEAAADNNSFLTEV
eukprot:CCRYP_006667-RA/>CCRYP_006667-RA protein AED:0.06 eAED:0.06 QI:474/1/1/1/1/1/2/1893/812